VIEYYWDFGDDDFDVGPEVKHGFKKAGEYFVKLGLSGNFYEQDREIKCIIKPLRVLSDNQALAMYMSGIEPSVLDEIIGERDESLSFNQDFSLFDINPEEEVFRVEVLSSENKILLKDTIFDPLREVYEIKEFYLSEDSLYSYTVGENSSLLSSYDIYSDVVKKGFSSAKVKTYVLAELPTEVVAKINRDFADLADANFEFNQSVISKSSYSLLDKIVIIMEDNPTLAMEIAAHTDNIGSFEFNMALSQSRAQSIVDYLVAQGIEKQRLVGKGYGESRPIATNNTEEGRLSNRRVEFLILNK
jgi:outer membrane protein OmpA-like peptidoglycan-associated protein